MTRINVIHPLQLSSQHRLAEYRELPRIFSLVRKSHLRGESLEALRSRQPGAYTMGTGHCLFFYDKLAWLSARYKLLSQTLAAKGVAVKPILAPDLMQGIPRTYFNKWVPSVADRAANLERLVERSPTDDIYRKLLDEAKKELCHGIV